MVKAERHRGGIQARVLGIEHGAGHRHAVMRFERRRNVRRQHRHRVADPDTGLGQCRGQTMAALAELPIGIAALAMNDRRLVRIDRGGALEETEGRQRGVVRRVLVQIPVIDPGRHFTPPLCDALWGMVGAPVRRVKGTSKAAGHGRNAAMQVDVFSDTICPWCFVGKRRFERALSIRPQSGLRVRWRAFQLNPAMPAEGMERQAYLEAKFGGGDRARSLYDTVRAAGAGESIEFRFDLIKRTPSTLLSHRLLRRAMAQGQQDTLMELIFRGYFQEGQDIGNKEVLAEMADAVGMGEQSVLEYLDGHGRCRRHHRRGYGRPACRHQRRSLFHLQREIRPLGRAGAGSVPADVRSRPGT